MRAKLSLTNTCISRKELESIKRTEFTAAKMMTRVAQAQAQGQWIIQENGDAKNEALKKKTVCKRCRKVKCRQAELSCINPLKSFDRRL